MIPSGSKGSLKIRRQSFDGNTIYQQQLIKGTITEGFAADSHKNIEWGKNKTVKSPVYTEKAYAGQARPARIVPLDLWLPVYRDDNTTIEVSPGSQGRFNICISQPFEAFARMANAVYGMQLSSPFQIPPELKLVKNKSENNSAKNNIKRFVEFLPKDIQTRVNIPRKDSSCIIKILSVGQTVRYSYTEESTRVTLRKLYQEAYLKQ